MDKRWVQSFLGRAIRAGNQNVTTSAKRTNMQIASWTEYFRAIYEDKVPKRSVEEIVRQREFRPPSGLGRPLPSLQEVELQNQTSEEFHRSKANRAPEAL
jgi:hypothetical protein